MIYQIPQSMAAGDNRVETLEPSSVPSFRHAYHEIGEQHVVETDVLEQLKSNITQLEDLHGRLKFMMGEIQALLVKKS